MFVFIQIRLQAVDGNNSAYLEFEFPSQFFQNYDAPECVQFKVFTKVCNVINDYHIYWPNWLVFASCLSPNFNGQSCGFMHNNYGNKQWQD